MLPKTRVLLADDSVTVRRLLSDTLAADPTIEVVAAARDGQEAVVKFPQYKPDVVVLDVEMPVMDGIEAVVAIRKLDPRVPIVMFSSLTMKGGQATFDALSHGATDYVTKPSQSQNMLDAINHIRSELIPKIKHLGQRSRPAVGGINLQRGSASGSHSQPHFSDLPMTSLAADKFDVIAVGVSTGGPNALADMLKHIPKTFSVPILIAQHMPAMFTSLLAERLDQVCPLTVREATDGAQVEPGQVWIAPGDQHMLVERQGLKTVLQLNREQSENSCRPSVDVLFRSVATTYHQRALAIVLTGMGSDGKRGCQMIRDGGGKVIVQDEATSVVWGMPGSVAEAGLANAILPLPEIAQQLSRLSLVGRSMATAGH